VRTRALLTVRMTEAFERLRTRCEGLPDEEFSWGPVSGAWRVFRDPTVSGGWAYDYELPEPNPAPFTTIGWRLNHLALCR
jgi:hypothetical protein